MEQNQGMLCIPQGRYTLPAWMKKYHRFYDGIFWLMTVILIQKCDTKFHKPTHRRAQFLTALAWFSLLNFNLRVFPEHVLILTG